MSGELVPNPKHLMADADRERVVTRLHSAVGEGRLTLSEFEDRVSGVLAARTYGEIEPFVADLPGQADLLGQAGLPGQVSLLGQSVRASPGKPVELSALGSSIKRTGPWTVPAEMRIKAMGSSVLLDLRTATLTSNVVHIDVDLTGSSLKMIVPEGSSVDASGASLAGSATKVRRIPDFSSAGQTGAHYVVTGHLRGSSIKASPPRRPFWSTLFGRFRTNRTS